jgi:hypothetical protein
LCCSRMTLSSLASMSLDYRLWFDGFNKKGRKLLLET